MNSLYAKIKNKVACAPHSACQRSDLKPDNCLLLYCTISLLFAIFNLSLITYLRIQLLGAILGCRRCQLISIILLVKFLNK